MGVDTSRIAEDVMLIDEKAFSKGNKQAVVHVDSYFGL